MKTKTNRRTTLPIAKVNPEEVVITTTTADLTEKHNWNTNVAHFIDLIDINQSSVKLYARTLRLFFEWVESKGKRLNKLTRSDIIEYRTDLFAKGLKPLTIASYLTSLRKFYEWAEGEGLYKNIMHGVKTPKRVQAFKKMHLTDEESKNLLTHFQSISLRDYAIVNLILHTGLRTIEVIRADVGDITTMANRRVLKVWGKGRDTKDDFVVLTDKNYKPIKAYLDTRKKCKADEPLFASVSHRNTGERLTTRSIRRLVKEGLEAIGLEGLEYSTHSLRHTTAVAVLNNGGSLTDAQSLLRHTSSDTTQIYVESIKQELRLRNCPEEIVDKAF